MCTHAQHRQIYIFTHIHTLHRNTSKTTDLDTDTYTPQRNTTNTHRNTDIDTDTHTTETHYRNTDIQTHTYTHTVVYLFLQN